MCLIFLLHRLSLKHAFNESGEKKKKKRTIYWEFNALYCAKLKAWADSQSKRKLKRAQELKERAQTVKDGVDCASSCFTKGVLQIKGGWAVLHFLRWPRARAQHR